MAENNNIENLRLYSDEIVKRAARKRLQNFVRYIRPDLVFMPFHEIYYEILNRFANGEIKKLIITIPPQHGKSEGSSRFLPAYLLGINPNLRISIASYAANIAEDFNSDVQKIIETEEYAQIFPDTFLSGMRKTATTTNYKRNSLVCEIVDKKGWLRSVGRGGSLTSKTIDVSILDDVYKDYAEGNSPVIRESAWDWYTSVVKTRLHNKSREIIVFTRWHEEDIIGRLERSDKVIEVNSFEDLKRVPKKAWVKVNFQAIKHGEPTEFDQRQEGEALWEEMHSIEDLKALRLLDPVKFECLHQGNPSSAEGRLYHEFKTYSDKTEYGTYIRSGCYIDVADEGNDQLVAICYDIYKGNGQYFDEKKKRFFPLLFALVTDAVITEESTEITTITCPEMINRNNSQKVWVEANNGGSVFEKQIRAKVRAQTIPFHQTANKESRIITASAVVNNQIVFPIGWETRFPQLHNHLLTFLRDFKANKHDDAEDALTGIYEKELLDGNDKPYSAMQRGVTRRN